MTPLADIDRRIAERAEERVAAAAWGVGDDVLVTMNAGPKLRARVVRMTRTRAVVLLKLNGHEVQVRRGRVERERP